MPESLLTPIGLFGGIFDPVHHGHLRLAEEARETLGLSKVRWLPAGLPTHREKPRAASQHRLAMLARALAGNATFELDDALAADEMPAYTIDALAHVRRNEKNGQPLVWLMGADAFAHFHTWRRWQEIAEQCHIAVLTRPREGNGWEKRWPEILRRFVLERQANHREALTEEAGGRIIFVSMPALDISSSDIRARLSAGASVRYLLPESVSEYIACHNLYTSAHHSQSPEF
ncbi:MAG: nicotinate-nucleotide adenylyltransferase [Betaproteobacteria bacterium]|nr:nicotinate-nucleotide adenylyltransferase [Betaproteobacteria bacterium]